MKRSETGRWLLGITVVLALACSNLTGLTTTSPGGSPSGTATVQVTVTPPPCPGGSPVVGPAPDFGVRSTSGNFSFAILLPKDGFDGDGNLYRLVWLCAPPIPSEVFQDWDVSCCDGDVNVFLAEDDSWPCCAIQPPLHPPVLFLQGRPVYRWEEFPLLYNRPMVNGRWWR